MIRRQSPSLSLEPPLPTRGTGPCRADKLFDLPGFCPERASRRVLVGLRPATDVCIWHSLCAVEQLGAYLVRQLSRRSP